jgi:DNA-binding Lrp family transcriptional regulator
MASRNGAARRDGPPLMSKDGAQINSRGGRRGATASEDNARIDRSRASCAVFVAQMLGNARSEDRNLPETLDAVDARILDLIQHDAGLSVAEVAERVGLSSSPCWRRIKRLEDAGVIQRRVTILDREKLGLGFEVYCTAKLSLPTKQNLEAFEAAIAHWPEVVQCATVTGAADYELRIVTRDMHAFDDFLRDKLLSLGLVSNVESRIVIRGVKNSTAVPLGLVSPHLGEER